MPVGRAKTGKPLGGIGAQAMSRSHSLVLDDRLLSKQYISAKTNEKVDDTAFSSSWATDTTTAPSKSALHAKFNALNITTSAWTQSDPDLSTAKTKTYDSGFVGIGSTLDYDDDITEMLTVGGNLKTTGDAKIGDDIFLTSDSAVINFGADSDTSLTHTDGTGLTLNSTNKLCFYDDSQFIQGTATILSIGATDEIDLTASEVEMNATTIDMNGNAEVSGNLTVGGNTTITGNLTVNGTATSIASTNVTTGDNIITLNNDVTSGSPTQDAGIEVRRGDSATVALRWKEDGDKWQITSDGSTYLDLQTTASAHDAITLADNGQNLLALSGQVVTVNDVVVKTAGDAMTGNLDIQVAGSTDNCLTIVGGNSAAANAAVSIEGHLEATTKSFNIPHPLLEHKRLVYGSLEGPEHGMYARGSFDVDDERRKVAIDLPMYWSKMVHHDYTVNLTTYGDYNVWITERDENGFWVETNSEKEWSFDWNVIGGRRDAKLVVEPDA